MIGMTEAMALFWAEEVATGYLVDSTNPKVHPLQVAIIAIKMQKNATKILIILI